MLSQPPWWQHYNDDDDDDDDDEEELTFLHTRLKWRVKAGLRNPGLTSVIPQSCQLFLSSRWWGWLRWWWWWWQWWCCCHGEGVGVMLMMMVSGKTVCDAKTCLNQEYLEMMDFSWHKDISKYSLIFCRPNFVLCDVFLVNVMLYLSVWILCLKS